MSTADGFTSIFFISKPSVYLLRLTWCETNSFTHVLYLICILANAFNNYRQGQNVNCEGGGVYSYIRVLPN